MSEGTFVWYDFMAEDVEKGIAFYTESVGWKTQSWDGDSDTEYTMFAVGDKPIGGITKLPDEAKAMGAPPHWLAYTSVENVDASAKKAESLGAKILSPPMDIPEVGRFSVIADPQGAVFAIFHSTSDEDADWEPVSSETPGAFSWHELMTSDLEGAFDFYSELFDWNQTDSMDMGEMGEYRLFGQGEDENSSYGGMMNKPEEVPAPFWLYYVTVADLDAGIERVKSHGGQLVNGPMEVPGGGKIAQFVDDQGAMFAFFQGAGES